jgi:predicted transcriptional regulator
MEIKEIVLKTLVESAEPLKGGEIAEKSGLDKKDVDKAIKQLKNEELIYSPKRCFYDAAKK